jgi:hypothetical protein
LAQPDPFVSIANGRSPLHVADLAELAQLIKDLDDRSPKVIEGAPVGCVKQITPNM